MAVPDVLAGVSYTPEELESPQWVDVEPDPEPGPAATPAKQRKGAKAVTPAKAPEVVEADTAPREAAEPDRPVDLTAVEAAEQAAEAAEWRAQWFDQLEMALNAGDLDAIQSLGNDATRARADDLVEEARNAWTIVSGQ